MNKALIQLTLNSAKWGSLLAHHITWCSLCSVRYNKELNLSSSSLVILLAQQGWGVVVHSS